MTSKTKQIIMAAIGDYLEYKNNRKRDKGRNSGYNCRGGRKRR